MTEVGALRALAALPEARGAWWSRVLGGSATPTRTGAAPGSALGVRGPHIVVRICTMPNGTSGPGRTAHTAPLLREAGSPRFHQRSVDPVANPTRWANGETDPRNAKEGTL